MAVKLNSNQHGSLRLSPLRKFSCFSCYLLSCALCHGDVGSIFIANQFPGHCNGLSRVVTCLLMFVVCLLMSYNVCCLSPWIYFTFMIVKLHVKYIICYNRDVRYSN